MGDLLSAHQRARLSTDCEPEQNGHVEAEVLVGNELNGVRASGTKRKGSSEEIHNKRDACVEFTGSEFSISKLESRRPMATQWATLDELLDRLLFLAVSGDGRSLSASYRGLTAE